MGRSKAPSLPIKALSFCRPTELRGWQRNWIHRGAPRPANPVTCFPPGKVVAPATKGGMHFPARRAVVWFSDGRKPGCKGFIQNWRLLSIKRRRTSPVERYFIPPEGGALNPSGRRQPVPDRTFGAQGRQARRRHQPSPAGRQPSGIPVSAVPPHKGQ